VSIIDGKTFQLLDTLAVGKKPNSVAVDQELNKAFISNILSNNVYVVDDHAVVGIIPVQSAPRDVIVDRKHHLLFVANTNDHSISVAQTRSHTVLLTGSTQRFPIDVAVNSEQNMLYAIHRDRPTLFVSQIVLE
jgi:DNA-binding beta-propeller fold protein YncE